MNNSLTLKPWMDLGCIRSTIKATTIAHISHDRLPYCDYVAPFKKQTKKKEHISYELRMALLFLANSNYTFPKLGFDNLYVAAQLRMFLIILV